MAAPHEWGFLGTPAASAAQPPARVLFYDGISFSCIDLIATF